MIKGIILDLDGLISDTERLHQKAYINAFKDVGIELSPEVYQRIWIKEGKGVDDFLEEINKTTNIKKVRQLKRKYYDYYLETDLYPMDYAVEFIKYFSGKVPLGVASASREYDVRKVLETFDVLKYLEFYLTYDDVEKSKPDPEIWLKSAKKLNLKPEECICLEDAEKGVIAAYRANLPVIAIPTEFTKDNDFSKADYIMENLKEAKEFLEKKIK